MQLLGRRLARFVLVLVVVTFLSAVLVSVLPGDPAEVIIPFGSDEQRAQLRDDLDLNDPLPVRYGQWLKNLVVGDENGEHFGYYYRQSLNDPVSERIGSAAPVSLQLMIYAQALALVVAVPLAVASARRAGGRLDRFGGIAAFAALAVPNYVLALVLALFVGVNVDWIPPTGYTAPADGLGEHLRTMLLPSVALAAGQVAVYLRVLRADLIATLQEDFILMAKSKGISERRILWRHALRPSSISLLTIAGLNIGSLIGGALIIEVIFDLPGMGSLLLDAIGSRQYVALQSLVAVIALAFVAVNFAVDMLYAAIDPRIRHGH